MHRGITLREAATAGLLYRLLRETSHFCSMSVLSRTLSECLPTDMHDVAVLIQHNVAVMPVLDLQQEQRQRVGGHRLDKVSPGVLPTTRTFYHSTDTYHTFHSAIILKISLTYQGCSWAIILGGGRIRENYSNFFVSQRRHATNN